MSGIGQNISLAAGALQMEADGLIKSDHMMKFLIYGAMLALSTRRVSL